MLIVGVFEEHGYTKKEQLGQGISGIVYLVTNKAGDSYVIKQMNSRNSMELNKVQVEVMILKRMNYGYIVSYVESFEDKATGLFFIVMEYCAGGDLYKRMQTQAKKGFFKEQQILDWFVQICLALQYLHDERRNVLHRDIKPQNVFLTEDDYIKLGDFGYSKVHRRADPYSSSALGTEFYASPECYQKKYSSQSDIWSLGWLLYDLCMLDVWSDVKKRHFQQASHAIGHPLHFSKRYSKDLQKLIKEMLSCDPNDRPSANEILAKPFLSDAVKRNKRIPQALEQRFMVSLSKFNEAYSKHYNHFKTLVEEWGETTDSLEKIHHKWTIGTLSGSVIGTAGGITALVGAILAPFTCGASLIVTAVGTGVGVAGGLTGAASSILNTVQQKSLRENIEIIQQKFTDVTPLLDSLNTLIKVLKTIQIFSDFFIESSNNVQISHSVDSRKVVCAKELMNLGLLANVGRIATQTSRVGRAAAEAVAAVTGVLSGILVIVDAAFIAVDAIDIHQMRQGKVNDPKKVKSSLLKSIAQMRKIHTDLCDVVDDIQKTRNSLNEYITEAQNYRDLGSSNIAFTSDVYYRHLLGCGVIDFQNGKDTPFSKVTPARDTPLSCRTQPDPTRKLRKRTSLMSLKMLLWPSLQMMTPIQFNANLMSSNMTQVVRST
ncbi:uncharacterized protein [Garra rufa]|uniref:uncharacterized protein n=1 Tax=Garra rufa TaxID=137080 RepID=UPI003CCE93D0